MTQSTFRKFLRRMVLIIILLTLSAISLSAGVLPAGQREYGFVYDRMMRLQALRLDLIDYQLGPYCITDSLRLPAGLAWLHPEIGKQASVFGFPATDYAGQKHVRSSVFESFRGGLAGQPIDQVYLYGSFTVDESLAEDSLYRGKVWRGLAGDVEDAFVYLKLGSFRAQAGRFASFWGIRNSLVLGEHRHMDGLGYTFRWGRFALSYRLARLDGLTPERDEVALCENRYLAAHRFDWHIAPSVRIGAFEAVVFGGPGRQVDLFYLNPLLFYHGTQLNEGTDDNTLVGLDFTVRPMLGWQVYGQVIIDDLQIERTTQADEEPDQYGMRVGSYLAEAFASVDLHAEYTRVTNWTFNQILERNRYTFNGRPIGSVRGNDYDEFTLAAIRWLSPDLAARLNLGALRQGEGNISDPFTMPWLDIEGDYDEPFPTGSVERRFSASLQLEGMPLDFLFVDIETGLERVQNYRHRAGDDRTLPFVKMHVSGLLSALVKLD